MSAEQKIILLCCLGVILGNVLVRVTLVKHRSASLVTLQQAVNQQQRAVAGVDDRADAEKWARMARDMDQVLAVGVPHVFDLPAFAGRVVQGIHQNGLILENQMVFQAEESPLPQVHRYVTAIRVRGPYPGLKRFLVHIQNFPEIAVMEDVHFVRSQDSGETVVLSLRLALFLKGSADG